MVTLAVLVGSLRKQSLNRKLALAMERLVQPSIVFDYVDMDAIPMFNQDDELHPAAGVVALKEKIVKADGVLLVGPEYNRSIAPVLKNAIDWASRPMGFNSWEGKPVALAGISLGTVGTAVAQAHLRGVVTMLGMALFGRPELHFTYAPDFFAEDGSIGSETMQEFIKSFFVQYEEWVKRVARR